MAWTNTPVIAIEKICEKIELKKLQLTCKMVSYELNSYALNNLKGILYKFRFRSGMTSCQSSSVLSQSTMNYRQQPASAPSTSIEAKFGEEKSSAFLCRHRLQRQDWHLVFNDQ